MSRIVLCTLHIVPCTSHIVPCTSRIVPCTVHGPLIPERSRIIAARGRLTGARSRVFAARPLQIGAQLIAGPAHGAPAVAQRIHQARQSLSNPANHCQTLGVRPSMGSRGDAYDNAMAESLFATLEVELPAKPRFTSHVEPHGFGSVARYALIALIVVVTRRSATLRPRSCSHAMDSNLMPLISA